MDALPSMWRTELWHPLIVHLPIALLLVGTGMRLVGMLLRRYPGAHFLVPGGRLLLLVGTIGAWAAVYTGTLADAEVARTLCDPTVVETHEFWAYRVAWLFTAGILLDCLLFLDGVQFTGRLSALLRKGAVFLLIGSLVSGSAGLAYVGHLGTSLVYQQAAAVHQPTENCTEFE